eukprot:6483660-Amphidinium_carterae.1
MSPSNHPGGPTRHICSVGEAGNMNTSNGTRPTAKPASTRALLAAPPHRHLMGATLKTPHRSSPSPGSSASLLLPKCFASRAHFQPQACIRDESMTSFHLPSQSTTSENHGRARATCSPPWVQRSNELLGGIPQTIKQALSLNIGSHQHETPQANQLRMMHRHRIVSAHLLARQVRQSDKSHGPARATDLMRAPAFLNILSFLRRAPPALFQRVYPFLLAGNC